MELQWPLILFTLFISWSAGLYAALNLHALAKGSKTARMPALASSAVLLAIGGVAVFFHLEHWDRIFNGFGHLSSGITQELIAVVAIALCMVATLAALRRTGGDIPAALAVLNVAAALALVLVTGHSYMMSARPTWENPAQMLSLLGNACVLGPASYTVIDGLAKRGEEHRKPDSRASAAIIIGSIANAATTCAFIASMAASSSSFTQIDRFFDGILATKPLATVESYSPFFGDALGMTVAAISLSVAAAALAVASRRKSQARLPVLAMLVVACGAMGSVALRMAMYATGGSVFMYY
ncbi:MAG TPA: hypothetical protein H9823_09665 [Candidatus Rubneribacter avistercoris]|nr:hypothetical protein [Candidatus Rubneribacter avistercoris]